MSNLYKQNQEPIKEDPFWVFFFISQFIIYKRSRIKLIVERVNHDSHIGIWVIRQYLKEENDSNKSVLKGKVLLILLHCMRTS